jgi:hypothetical protein
MKAGSAVNYDGAEMNVRILQCVEMARHLS